MTNAELISYLQQLPPDDEVVMYHPMIHAPINRNRILSANGKTIIDSSGVMTDWQLMPKEPIVIKMNRWDV